MLGCLIDGLAPQHHRILVRIRALRIDWHVHTPTSDNLAELSYVRKDAGFASGRLEADARDPALLRYLPSPSDPIGVSAVRVAQFLTERLARLHAEFEAAAGPQGQPRGDGATKK